MLSVLITAVQVTVKVLLQITGHLVMVIHQHLILQRTRMPVTERIPLHYMCTRKMGA